MGRRFVPFSVVASILAFVVGAIAVALVPERPSLWPAAVRLVVLGGITTLIYTVNVRLLPVFSRRNWQRPNLLFAGIMLGAAGGWLSFAGRASAIEPIEQVGSVAALAGGLIFIASIRLLFHSPVTTKIAPQAPFPEQVAVDRIGTLFTRLSTLYLLLGLIVGVVTAFWTPERGRWDLVWAHAMLVGWFLSMASGVVYHALPRWTGQRWRRPRLIRLHLRLVALGLPVMILALALDLDRLFLIAGPLQSAALLVFVWNIVPSIRRLPTGSRLGLSLAGGFLALGVSIGASMAIDPGNHATMRLAHAQINLFGWSGLLICGVGYYLFPRFAGQALRWPRLVTIQIVTQAASTTVAAFASWWYLSVDPAAGAILTVAGLLTAASLATFALIVGLTFRGAGRTVSSIGLTARRPSPAR